MGAQLPIYDNNFPVGTKIGGVPIATGIPIQGKYIFVKPYSGHDSADGLSPENAVKTLAQAQLLAVANQNDTVVMFAESNTAAGTTDYQSANLAWAKDGVHLIGVNAGPGLSQRSRIAQISSWTSANPLMTLSANGCFISGIEMFSGVADATTLGCLKVTGMRNKLANCHIAGIGNTANDIGSAYSLYLYDGHENLFERCTIGIDTIDRGTAQSGEIVVASASNGCRRNKFLNCDITMRIKHNTYHPAIYLVGNQSATFPIDNSWMLFDRCNFISLATNWAYTNAVVALFATTNTRGDLLFHNCAASGFTNYCASGQHAYVHAPIVPTAYTAGTGYAA